MLKKVELQELKMQNNNLESLYDCQRMPLFKLIEKFDCKEILTTNNLIQVLAGIIYHNGIENMPITFYFKAGMNFTEFINTPTVRLFPSIFVNVRALTYNKKFIGIWASTLFEGAKLAYKELYDEDRIDSSLKSIFRINKKVVCSLNQQSVTAFEIISDEHLAEIENCISFSKLKKFFDRVFIVGSGEEVWKSTHIIVNRPKNELINTILQ